MTEPRRRIAPLPLQNVALRDGLLAERQRTNRDATLPAVFAEYERSGRIAALSMQPGRKKKPDHPFWGSDVAKWLEGACCQLMIEPDAALRRKVDRVAKQFAAAAQDDGYINTFFTVFKPRERWNNLKANHELYCAGHMMEAAVAHHAATGSTVMLDALERFAALIRRTFGRGRGKMPGYPGHEEIELALVKLYRHTGDRRHLELAKYFVDERGRKPHWFDIEAKRRGDGPGPWSGARYAYHQAHRPVREQDEAVGHAVRAVYLYSGMADVAAETGDAELWAACRRLWRSITERKMYVTGGIGSRHSGEMFGPDYELTNELAYAETCAAIGLAFFAHRMLQIDPDGVYADVMERALFNGALSGLSRDGEHFFYVNPLASAGGHHRQPGFHCSCCPPNIVRLLASLGTYAVSAGEGALWLHLYLGGAVTAELGGQSVTLEMTTDYPYDGRVELTVQADRPARFDLALRVPGWCRGHTLTVNGEAVTTKPRRGYVHLRRRWSDGDRVVLELPMPIERVAAHPHVAADAGKVALERGPLVYCLENCDHRVDVRSIVLPDAAGLEARRKPGLLGGTVVIEGAAAAETSQFGRVLYRPSGATTRKQTPIRAVPYFLWDNRKSGPMVVWMPRG